MTAIDVEIKDYTIDVTVVNNTDVIEASIVENVINVTIQWWWSAEWPSAYTHTQSVASSTRTITHNLWYNPNYIAVDTAWDEIEGAPSRPNTNTMVITFSAATGWVAYLS